MPTHFSRELSPFRPSVCLKVNWNKRYALTSRNEQARSGYRGEERTPRLERAAGNASVIDVTHVALVAQPALRNIRAGRPLSGGVVT
jgi:hypothetical protein